VLYGQLITGIHTDGLRHLTLPVLQPATASNQQRIARLGVWMMIMDILDGGTAEPMGDGVFMLMQKDEQGRVHRVVVEKADLEAMLAAS
jgi:hypothetical protein